MSMWIVYAVIAVVVYYAFIAGFNRSLMRDDVQDTVDAVLWAIILLGASVLWPVSLVVGGGAFLIVRMVRRG